MAGQIKNALRFRDFENEISLWQLITPGKGRAMLQLKDIVDSYLNSPRQSSKPLSVMITGREGKRLHALSFIRALGNGYINEMPWSLIESYEELATFLKRGENFDCSLITDFKLLLPHSVKPLYQSLKTGEFIYAVYMLDTPFKCTVSKPIVITCKSISAVPNSIKDNIDFIVELEDYTDRQCHDIIKQRLSFHGIEYEPDIVKKIALKYRYNLKKAMRMLQYSITVMTARNAKTLTAEHLQRVEQYYNPFPQPKEK